MSANIVKILKVVFSVFCVFFVPIVEAYRKKSGFHLSVRFVSVLELTKELFYIFVTKQVNKKWNNKEKSYYANITKHLNSVYKSVELDIDNICSILEHVGNDGKQRYTTNYAILPIGY